MSYHGQITKPGDEFNRDTEYFCGKCERSHTTAFGGCDGLRRPLPETVPPSALDVQAGGDHYKKLKIQPIEYIHANGIPFAEGSVIKYLTRWRTKGGVEDLKKARHFIDLLIELETRTS